MAIEVTLPRQGWSMEEAAFVGWLKQDGETVKAGELLFAVETDKAVQEIESLDGGILRLTPNSPKEGDKVRVADVLGYLVAPGEATPAGAPAPPPASKTESGEVAAPASKPVPAAAAFEVARNRIRENSGVLREGQRPPQPPNSHEFGYPPSKCATSKAAAPVSDVPPVPAGRPVSPRAARRAVQEGVDLRAMRGTGRGGRIRERDVLAATRGGGAVAVAPPVPAAPAVPPIPGREVQVTTLRRTVAERMYRSKTLTAPVTLTTRVDAAALVRLRQGLKDKANEKDKAVPAYGDIILREAAQALLEHPALNARWEEDHIRHPDFVNIGFAVDTDAGLVVPVVRDAPTYDLEQLAGLTRDLAERARTRRLAPEELSGGTFTITNLGTAGIDAFTPIINWPECAVLGIGRITREPVVQGKKVVVGDRLWLSLTFDHRLVDGAPAARFLDTLCRRIESLEAEA